jgi:hypothetical protein
MYIVETTRYKEGEELHPYIADYVESITKVWLIGHTLTVSRVAPGIIHNPNNTKLITAELFQVKEENFDHYKTIVGNRHTTWERITGVYSNTTTDISDSVDVIAPILRPLNTLFGIDPIYYVAPQLTNWTSAANIAILDKAQNATIKASQQEFHDKFCPAAMDI